MGQLLEGTIVREEKESGKRSPVPEHTIIEAFTTHGKITGTLKVERPPLEKEPSIFVLEAQGADGPTGRKIRLEQFNIITRSDTNQTGLVKREGDKIFFMPTAEIA